MTTDITTNEHRRPEILECDVVRFQNAKAKWVAFVGLLDGRPYEIFTGLQDDEEGIMLPKAVNSGKIIKTVLPDGTKRYDFQFENRRRTDGKEHHRPSFPFFRVSHRASLSRFFFRVGASITRSKRSLTS